VSKFEKVGDFEMDNKKRLDEIKAGIKDRLARPTLVQDITKQTAQQNSKNMGWVLKEIKDDPGGSFLLAISMLFTAMLGVYLGLTPHLAPDPNNPAAQVIAFDTDFGHVVTAILYVLALWTVTELAFFYSRHKFHIREETNGHQLWTMWVAMFLAFISIVVTGGAGGTVVASTLGFLSEFKSVPPSLQKWLVWIIPSLFGIYLALHTIYRLSSEKAKAERIAQQTREQQELEHRMIMEQLELEGEEEIMLEEIERYKDLIRRGKISRGQARAAIRAGKSVGELETELGKDLDEDGGVGTVHRSSSPLASLPKAVPGHYRDCPACQNRNVGNARFCAACGWNLDEPVYGYHRGEPITKAEAEEAVKLGFIDNTKNGANGQNPH
jgi:hypothetical protein